MFLYILLLENQSYKVWVWIGQLYALANEIKQNYSLQVLWFYVYLSARERLHEDFLLNLNYTNHVMFSFPFLISFF